MIRVNLLAAERPTQKKKAPSAPGAVQLYLFIFIFVGGALALCAIGWFLITQKIADLDRQIQVKQDRLTKLQAIKKQVDEFEAKKKELEAKVNLIDRLHAEQSGPVHMLDEISKSLPDFVWLDNLDQTGPAVSLKGSTTGLNSVADFISALTRSGWFPSVELRTTLDQSGIVVFELGASFLDPTLAAKQAAAAQAAKGAGPAASASPAAPAR
jgi:type IV pilus assembly protein PilN